MSEIAPGTQEWLDQVVEETLEPELRIVDPHHHLWPEGGSLPYGPDALAVDTNSGHRIDKTVFIECGAAYRTEGDPDFFVVGETAFVAAAAKGGASMISGIVAKADLRADNLDDVLDAHVEASGGLFVGIRDALASANHPDVLRIPGRAPKGLSSDPSFQAGVRRLGERGFTYDSWHYHYQNQEFLQLARSAPETTMVLDHFGTPLGVGPYASEREAIFEQWKLDLAAIAECENVVLKLGGLAMPDNGFGWHTAAKPPTSDEFLAQQSRYYLHGIEVFGPERCMFESNFPVDRFSLSYGVFWNACKKLTVDFSPDERAAMFATTAERVYGI
ncbi:MAG: amidohydrolase family protein [Acidimicrobiales bacterium]